MTARVVKDVLEDLTFLADDGVGGFEAARRTGFNTAGSLEKWLDRRHQYDLWLRLKSHDPVGSHEQAKMNARKRREEKVVDTIADLITQAHDCGAKRIQRQAERVNTLIIELRTNFTEYTTAELERAEAQAEVDRLEQELAEARVRLTGRKPRTETPTAINESATIRAWAAENGMSCPSRGRIPKVVRDAYEAHDSAA